MCTIFSSSSARSKETSFSDLAAFDGETTVIMNSSESSYKKKFNLTVITAEIKGVNVSNSFDEHTFLMQSFFFVCLL